MFDLITIGDPVIDTHVQIDASCTECEIKPGHTDQICLQYGAKIPIVDSFQSLGGNAPNVAVAAAKLGLKTALLTTIGGDVNGEIALNELKRHGVDVSLIHQDSAAKTRYSIILNYRGERTILSYSAEKKYFWPKHVPGATWVYYTGLSKGFETIQEALIQHLGQQPTLRLAINPGSYIMKYAKTALLDMLPRTDVLLVNREEAELILNTSLRQEKEYSTLVRDLLSLGPQEVVLTDGLHGSWAGTKDGIWHLGIFPVEVTAKTGAGDAFSAAYLCARSHGHDLAVALQWGTANSTSVIQFHGPHHGLLTFEKTAALVKKFSMVQPIQVG